MNFKWIFFFSPFKILVVLIGCFSIGMVFVVERLGNIFSLAISIVGVTAGTLLGMFTLGMAFPNANQHVCLFLSYSLYYYISLFINVLFRVHFGVQLFHW